MTLTVHHLQVSQSERIVWLCEELGIPYELKLHKRDPLLSPPEIQALHPLKAAPIIEDNTFTPDKPLVLAESAAIAEYIINKHGNGRLALPPSHPHYADYLYWFHHANSGIQPAMQRCFTLSLAGLGSDNPLLQMMNDRRHTALTHFDKRVSENTWLAGEEFTAADIMNVFSLTTMRTFVQYDLGPYKGILAYLKRVSERPGYQRAMEKGDPGMKLALGAESPPLHPALPK